MNEVVDSGDLNMWLNGDPTSSQGSAWNKTDKLNVAVSHRLCVIISRKDAAGKSTGQERAATTDSMGFQFGQNAHSSARRP